MTGLIVFTLLMLSVAATASSDMSVCAAWCVDNFVPPGQCIAQAAQGQGPCYTCGPFGASPTQQLCGGACVDTAFDSNNCGECDNVCSAGTFCCGSQCIDITIDNNNCGACGNVCPSDDHCSIGICTCNPGDCGAVPPCGPPSNCGCVRSDLFDFLNIGFCGNTDVDCSTAQDCISSAECVGGICSPDVCCGRKVCVAAGECRAFEP